jgi:hypothetical protein
MLGNTYDKIWEDRLLFFALERVGEKRHDAESIDRVEEFSPLCCAC